MLFFPKFFNDFENKYADSIYFFYDDKNIFRCPDCNNIKFYIDKKFFYHKCPINNNEITFDINKNKENKFKTKVNQIENKCNKHKNEFFSFYKDDNYYCGQCIREKK